MQRTTPYTWERFTGRIPSNAVHASDNYIVIRAYHANDWITGKYSLKDRKAYVPYDYKEIEFTSGFEILTAAPGANVEWVHASHGQVPHGTVGPIGKDQVFVGRAVCPVPENVHTPGKIHPTHKNLYIPFDGKEIPCSSYEACVINFSMIRWEKFNGFIPQQAVFASPDYVVIRALHGGHWVPGKFCIRQKRAYIAYDMKEVEVKTGFEILLHAPGTEARWVSAANGSVPSGGVGPFGGDGVYVGRAVCPKPEGAYTPGKIHPGHGCLYMPYDGKELNFNAYEALVIAPAGRLGWVKSLFN